ncbi:hypothetical protein [Mesobacterium pallidum]|uniref:hypothetical protein n=1 Tax=Mesobacterium pallidum TaxID=2872037 RepID=UPI001EE222BB|nr:hypothetical protein [Mesobacterium pallidum]
MNASDARQTASRREVSRLIEERESDHDRLSHEHPAPSWADSSAQSAALRRIAARERRIRYLTHRLEGATRKMERDFDISSF